MAEDIDIRVRLGQLGRQYAGLTADVGHVDARALQDDILSGREAARQRSPSVDVPMDRCDRSDLLKCCDNRRVADIACVQDMSDTAQRSDYGWVETTVSV